MWANASWAIVNVATLFLAPSSQARGGGGGRGYSRFQVTEWSNGDKNQPPPKKKETPETPENFFYFINENAKNPHVNEILTKKIPESKISTPQKSFNHPRNLKSGAPSPTPLSP